METMDTHQCVGSLEDSGKPIFSFARLRRCATVENDQPSPRHHISSSSSSDNQSIKTTTTSSSLSSLHSNLTSVLCHRNNTGVIAGSNNSGGSSRNQSFDNAPSSTSSSGSSSPIHTSSSVNSNTNQPQRGRTNVKHITDHTSHTNGKSTTTKIQQTTPFPSSSSSQILNNITRSSSIPPFSSFHNSSTPSTTTNTPTSPKQRSFPAPPLSKTSQSALTFSSSSNHFVSQKEKPIFRRYLSLIIFPSSLRQIPFMVPTSPHGMCSRGGLRPSDQKSLDDGSPSGKSEPTSPTSSVSTFGGKRPSVEIPGAYALGTIDPSLYKVADEDDHYDIPPDHIGRVWFATEYERETEKLMITLIKAKNLPSRTQGSDNACDPFVRLYLMPDERRYLQSKCRKKTCNPKFEETYVFQVSHRALEDRVLKLTVYDVDRHKRHQVIGHALYPLREHDCENNVRLVIWRDLEKEVSESTTNKGDLLVSLSYNNHMERLVVGVFESKDLHCSGSIGQHSMDTYTKVCLMTQNKLVKVKKTETVKKTTCPNFNESFTFKVPVSSLDNASVSIAVMEHVSGLKDRLVGRIVLGSFMFARGKELEHWNQMIANQREQITHWHTLS